MLIKKTGVAVNNVGDSTILDVVVESFNALALQITNLHASVALDNLDIYFKFSKDADYVKMTDINTDFTNNVYPVKRASGDLNVLAAQAIGWVILNIECAYAVQVKASAANTGVTVDIHGNAN